MNFNCENCLKEQGLPVTRKNVKVAFVCLFCSKLNKINPAVVNIVNPAVPVVGNPVDITPIPLYKKIINFIFRRDNG